jgi:hypothetical protein
LDTAVLMPIVQGGCAVDRKKDCWHCVAIGLPPPKREPNLAAEAANNNGKAPGSKNPNMPRRLRVGRPSTEFGRQFLSGDAVEILLRMGILQCFVNGKDDPLLAVHSVQHPHQWYCVDGKQCSCNRARCVHVKAAVEFRKRYAQTDKSSVQLQMPDEVREQIRAAVRGSL